MKLLYIGLSRGGSERKSRIAKSYQIVSQELYGKYAAIKTNLPWIIAGGFFVVALFTRFAYDIVIPVWIAVCFVIILAGSVFYSLALNREIIKHIDKEANLNDKSNL